MPQLPIVLSGISLALTQLCLQQRRQAPLLRPQHARYGIEGPESRGQPFYVSVTLPKHAAAGIVRTACYGLPILLDHQIGIDRG